MSAMGAHLMGAHLIALLISSFCLVASARDGCASGLCSSNQAESVDDTVQSLPTQFERAMIESLKAVREGRAPDPSLRKQDGSPGTLLDAILPFESDEEGIASTRRMLAASWRMFGATIPYLSGPTLAALNATFYRYSSVTPLSAVDWRQTIYVTPIQVQYDCPSCFAMSVADAMVMGFAIANGSAAIPAGVQQVCDCSGLGCCQGGWPEDVFNWLVTQGNITTSAFYNYWAMDGRACTLSSNYPVAGYITGVERVPSYSITALMQAVSMQPVMIYVSASSPDFMNYSSTAPGTPGFNIYDGNCTSEVNHAVVLVGYNTTGAKSYWIVKNTWPAFGWGHNGYMYMAMYDGPGKCGMQTINPLIPTYFPNLVTADGGGNSSYNSSSCSGMINPCGAGACSIANGVARCKCPSPYVELLGQPTSKCVPANPCQSSLINPCGAGNCMNVGDGSFICGCPDGYALGTSALGGPTCVPTSSLNVSTRTYTVPSRTTCSGAASSVGTTPAVLGALNPSLNCGSSKKISAGTVLILPSSMVACSQQYAVRPGETCSGIAYYMNRGYASSLVGPSTEYSLPLAIPPPSQSNYDTSVLLAYNPGLNCSNLLVSQQLCVNPANTAVSVPSFQCGQTYTTLSGDTCASIVAKYKGPSFNTTMLSMYNPGINCNYFNGTFYAGLQICIAPASPLTVVPCTQYYTVKVGDSCAQIWNAANLSMFQLTYFNPGLQCQAPYLYVGQQVCVKSPLIANIPDQSYIPYAIQPNDTLTSIQAQFVGRCQSFSVTMQAIADQNNITDWTTYVLPTSGTIVIPCVPKVGATCGCTTSLYVCGADLVTYPSYCDARCNFATPVFNSTNGCSTCQSACTGRYGQYPSPTTACPAGTVCPWPTWSPPLSDATAQFTTSPLCSYRTQTCTNVCALYGSTIGDTSTYCYNQCMACYKVPCSGPQTTAVKGSTYCPTCASSGCANYYTSGTTLSRTSCNTVCTYWNTWWNPLNP